MDESPVGGHVGAGRVPPDRALADLLCFALFGASRALAGLYRPILAELDLTHAQYLVLVCLWEGDVPTVGDLVSELGVDYSTMSPLLRRLEEKGLVRRERAPGDERNVQVHLTERGDALAEHAEHIPARVLRAVAAEPAELISLYDDLRALRARVAPELLGG